LTVIVVSFFESVVGDHSKDHAVAVVYFNDTLTAEPYTTLLDSTPDGAASPRGSRCHGGFLLDGYTRTQAQVEVLDDLLSASGCALDAVVALVVAHDEAVARLLGRNQGRADDTGSSPRSWWMKASPRDPVAAL